MDKLETLLKERYGNNCVKLSDTTYNVKDGIYIEKPLMQYSCISGSNKSTPTSQINIYNNEELLFSIVDRYSNDNNFAIDAAISFIDMLVEKMQ
jgi:hypothetical protein